MPLRTIIIAAAITTVAVLGTIGSASAGGGAKTTFQPTKIHVNVGTLDKGKGRAITGEGSKTPDWVKFIKDQYEGPDG